MPVEMVAIGQPKGQGERRGKNSIIIEGSKPLQGEVMISPSKNAILPIIAASLLSEGRIVIPVVPNLTDVTTMCRVLESLGLKIKQVPPQLIIENSGVDNIEPPYELVRKMRASILVLSPLLARQGKAVLTLPGGCAIGSRPIDLHLKGLQAMGAKISFSEGKIEAGASKLVGTRIYLDFPSVGATESLIMAATLAQGTTYLENAALEPEIINLASFLNAAGGRISGAGTNVIKIEGVNQLTGVMHPVIPDRIEAGTFMVAAAASGGEVVIKNIITEHLKSIIFKLREIGVEVEYEKQQVYVRGTSRLRPIVLRTMPYPGFPTDMQAQFMALLSQAPGTSVVTETIFENRFLHVNELIRMGANIRIEGRTAIIQGVPALSGTQVKATDLRAGAALVIAALAAQGRTEIVGSEHLDRGYEKLTEKLLSLGAKIERK